MNQDVWGKLWDRATSEPGEPAKIEVTDDPGHVTLAWPDGSRAALVWDNGDWQFANTIDSAPCDVAARDTL